jgi:hypothetical protein
VVVIERPLFRSLARKRHQHGESMMKSRTSLIIAAAVVALTACNKKTAADNQASAIEANASNEAANVTAAGENKAQNIMNSAENKASAVKNETRNEAAEIKNEGSNEAAAVKNSASNITETKKKK